MPSRESDTMAAPATAPAAAPDAANWLIDLVWRWRWWLFGWVAVFHLAAFNGQWRIEPDSALYLSLARNLAEGSGYRYLGQPHALAFPGLPWLVAATFRIFGTDVLWPAHVLMLAFAAAGLLLAYRLFSLHTTPRVAVFLTWALACTHFYFRYAFQLRNDLPFLVGVLACLAAVEAIFGRRPDPAIQQPPGQNQARSTAAWYDWPLLIGGLGLVVVMRPTMWVFVPVLLLSLAWSMRRRLRWPHLAGAGAVVLVLAGFLLLDPRRDGGVRLGDYEEIVLETMPRSAERAGQNLLRILDAAIPEVLLGVELEWTLLNAAAAIVIAALAVGLVRVRVLWGLWVAATLLMMLLIEPAARYLVAVLPLLIYGWWRGLVWLSGGAFAEGSALRVQGSASSGLNPEPRTLNPALRRLIPAFHWRGWAFLALVVLWLGPNIGKNVGLIIDQRRTPFLAHYREGRFLPMIELAGEINRHVPPEQFVIAPRGTGRVLSYYSDRRVVDAADLLGWQGPQAELFIIQPLEPESASFEPAVIEFLQRLSARAGPPLTAIERDADQPPLTLHFVPAEASIRLREERLDVGFLAGEDAPAGAAATIIILRPAPGGAH